MDSPRVCVVGSLNMDLVVRAPRLPIPGETLLGGSYKTFPGGKGANQAVAAARMGGRVSMVGRVGDDAHGAKLRSVLEENHIDCTHLLTTPGQPSGLGMITVADGGENTIVVASGANALVTPEDIHAAANLEAAKLAHGAGAAVILNAAPARSIPREFISLIDVLLVNRSEAAFLTSQEVSAEPGRLMLRAGELGPTTVIVTLGSLGSIVAHRGRQRRISTLQVTAVDAVGAGDAFSGSIAVSWPPVVAATKKKAPDELQLLERALLAASIAGAIAATRTGAIPSLPTKAEVAARLPELEGMPRAI
jgi:ribokinase